MPGPRTGGNGQREKKKGRKSQLGFATSENLSKPLNLLKVAARNAGTSAGTINHGTVVRRHSRKQSGHGKICLRPKWSVCLSAALPQGSLQCGASCPSSLHSPEVFLAEKRKAARCLPLGTAHAPTTTVPSYRMAVDLLGRSFKTVETTR